MSSLNFIHLHIVLDTRFFSKLGFVCRFCSLEKLEDRRDLISVNERLLSADRQKTTSEERNHASNMSNSNTKGGMSLGQLPW